MVSRRPSWEWFPLVSHVAGDLLPAAAGLPSASTALTERRLLDVLGARQDLASDFWRAVEKLGSGDASAALKQLLVDDPTAYGVLGSVIAAAYYTEPEVMNALSYPGQLSHSYSLDEVPEYVLNGWLQRVIDRGTLWRQPPGDASSASSDRGAKRQRTRRAP
jgi:hypothetical protein